MSSINNECPNRFHALAPSFLYKDNTWSLGLSSFIYYRNMKSPRIPKTQSMQSLCPWMSHPGHVLQLMMGLQLVHLFLLLEDCINRNYSCLYNLYSFFDFFPLLSLFFFVLKQIIILSVALFQTPAISGKIFRATDEHRIQEKEINDAGNHNPCLSLVIVGFELFQSKYPSVHVELLRHP